MGRLNQQEKESSHFNHFNFFCRTVLAILLYVLISVYIWTTLTFLNIIFHSFFLVFGKYYKSPFGTLAEWTFVATKNASNALFQCFRCKIKGATENGNFFSWKMVILKFFFQTQNQLFWHSQKTKVAFSRKAMME